MLDKQKARQEIALALKRFESYKESKLAPKETATRTDLIEPLFHALGWEVNNSFEVSKEEKVSKGRVDYGFKINGIPKFFLEAKELNEDLDGYRTVKGKKVTFAEQAISYAWYKTCTWAVLTNFRELRVYNAETKEANNKLFSLDCKDFLSKEGFDQLLLLSKESLEKNLIDKEAARWGKKSTKLPIDKQLSADFMRFRALLSTNISKLNQSKNITQEDLDESIQRILDRLIFIRNCEDRELEAKELLAGLREREGRGKGNLIKSLRDVFSYFDEQYNSKLFANHLCDKLDIDDDILHDIIDELYYTKDQSVYYDFSAIESDVLGNIYEQYLGHILKKSQKGAKVKDSPTHRKQQGIYYTPTYIVNYIVRNTLGELLKDKNVDVENIRVLDPACGSGSFLIKAFDVLNEHYAKHDKNYSQPQLDFRTGGAFTTKVKILKDNLYGVDLDKQAVEIAQLNLLLKIAEKGKKLPYLEDNVKCGNSLIDNPLISGDKAFAWQDKFHNVMQEGGFDVIIGNPPYVDSETMTKYNKKERFYLSKKYNSTKGNWDLYIPFIEKVFNLINENGRASLITPNKWLSMNYGSAIRKMLWNYLYELADYSNVKVFKEAGIFPIIFFVNKKQNNTFKVKVFSDENNYSEKIIKKNLFVKYDNFGIFFSGHIKLIIKFLEKNTPLGELCDLSGAFTTSEAYELIPYLEDKKINSKDYLKFVNTGTIEPYFPLWGVSPTKYIKKEYQNPIVSIKNIKTKFSRRFEKFNRPKIIISGIRNFESFYDEDNEYLAGKSTSVLTNLTKDYYFEFILCILNSKLIKFYLKEGFSCSGMEGGINFSPSVISTIPIAKVKEGSQKPFTKLADKMLSLNKRLNEIGDKKIDERAMIEEQIKKTYNEIDKLVYKLYGLTEKEIKIVEDGQKKARSKNPSPNA